ncbi:MAG TPA: type II secretion system F family protein [Thermodesulfobacteriota bacterium]|jgi:type IV pilus assembly protein PilC
MPVFAWEGVVRGKIQKGEMEAPSKSAVLTRLRQMQVKPIPSRVKEKGKLFSFNIQLGGVSTRELVVFTRQLATMIDAGLPLVKSLEVLSSQQNNAKFKNIISLVKEEVESGSAFADALSKHPKAFDSLYVNMARAGEAGGVLDVVLLRLAIYLEKIEAIRRRVKGALIYPAIVILVAILVLSLVIIFVVPTFAEVFKDLGTTLPTLTQYIINISFFARSNILYIIGSIMLISIFIILLYRRSIRVRRIFDYFLLKLWIVGDLRLKIIIARFSRTLATLIAGGIPILDGLEITSKASGNIVVQEAILEARKSVSEGQTLAQPLSIRPQIFTPMVVQMISVGEQTGGLEEMLNKIGDFYDDEVDVAIAALMSALEPAIIVFLGVTVGVIVIAMYLPMFKLISTLAS